MQTSVTETYIVLYSFYHAIEKMTHKKRHFLLDDNQENITLLILFPYEHFENLLQLFAEKNQKGISKKI